MGEQLQDPSGFQPGDKIRVRSGTYKGSRGVVRTQVDGLFEIQLNEGEIIRIVPEDTTNYSLAARRAWQVMPKRAGRPQLTAPRKKMVSIRLDIDVWDMLQEAGNRGLMPNREKAINDWIREQVVLLLSKEK
jgi:uncharacterized protein (DUF4415 family)